MIRFFNVYYPTRTVILVFGEALVVSACFLLATFLVLPQDDAFIVLNYEYGFFKIAGVTALTLLLSYYFDLYEPQIVSARKEIYFRVLLVLGFDCFILSGILYFFPDASLWRARAYVAGFLLLIPGFLFWRRAYEWLVTREFFRERIYVLGAGEFARSIVSAIQSRPDIGMEVVGWENITSDHSERKVIWIEALDRISKLNKPVHRIIVAMESQRSELPVEELLALRFRGIAVEEVGTLRERLSGKIQLDGLRPSSFLYSEGFRISSSQQFTRRVISMSAATTGLLICLPFLPFIVLAVRLSSHGPVLFRQTRTGVNGVPFDVIKFRTMFIDAEASGAQWATKNDPRVTRVGMFMRKTRLDEIPQLWNILRGDMDFVGPRPERPEFIPMLSENLPFYYLRHLIRPGLTGWAQIRYGYGATLAETKEKLEYDLYYLKHMSLGLDLFIMFETIKTIVRRRGAQ
ncbi:MAG: TIGR03013 family PEP-CTERM/XrtA system glycosyltransferase [Acidobacteriota bacterium]|nr:TIGR03013 family PEP-CTERM/XrtA system glycosyltransferase [Acidobacteriota bacterium]